MPRLERPIDPSDTRPLAGFARDLRALRHQKGNPPYAALAAKTRYVPTTLSKATDGRRLPTLDVTLALVSALGGDTTTWEQRWHALAFAQAAASAAPTASGRTSLRPVRPEAANTPAEFVREMRLLHVYAGKPSLRDMNNRVHGELPPSTLSDALRNTSLPSYRVLRLFLTACRLPTASHTEWEDTWKRLTADPTDLEQPPATPHRPALRLAG